MKNNVTIFLFHRDLRLVDHYALEAAVKDTNGLILPVFIFTPEQVLKNPFKSDNSVQFMLQSLKELAVQIRQSGSRLLFLYGDTVKTLELLIKELSSVICIYETKDYTPYAKKREESISKLCEKHSIQHKLVHDLYLTEPGTIRTGTNKIFQKFTPYYEVARKVKIDYPHGLAVPSKRWYKPKASAYSHEITLNAAYKMFLPKGVNNAIAVKGGRTEGLYLIKHIPVNYDTIRDFPAQKTSMLSAHNHFGTVSIREVYHGAKTLSHTRLEGFIRQLFWRDFHGALMDYFEELYDAPPYEFEGKTSLRGKTDESAKKQFELWKKGETGHMLVDAGIKQLLHSGYMHNRVRLLVASYLVKDCHVYWRWGERFLRNI
jgi:deoxyribodipyrimidine photo-lyase